MTGESIVFVMAAISAAAMARKLTDDIMEADADEIITDMVVLVTLIGAAAIIGWKVLWA